MGASPSDNRQLQLRNALVAVSDGDRGALKTVYELTSPKVYGTIVRIVRSRDRSEDVLQDVYVRVWSRAGRFDPGKGSAITWLCTIARNAALNEVRRSGRAHEVSDQAIPEVPDDASPPADEWLCHAEEREALNRCMEELQPDHRRSIRMAFFEGYSYSQLAEKVEVPLGTMKSWIRRGLSALKGCLDG